MKILFRLAWAVLFVLALILAINTVTYLNFDSHYSFLRLKQQAVETGFYLPFYYSHVLVSGLILLMGFFQISSTVRTKFPRSHKVAGRVYVFGIIGLAAPGALIMSFFINRGPLVFTSFLLQSICWIACTVIAFQKIRNHDVPSHRLWMWRSFAITLAAITLRLYVLLTQGSIDLSKPHWYGIVAWCSWLPNLILVEVFRRRFTPTATSAPLT